MSERRYRAVTAVLVVFVVLCVATIVVMLQSQVISNQHLIIQNQASGKGRSELIITNQRTKSDTIDHKLDVIEAQLKYLRAHESQENIVTNIP